jgi:RNA polymerase sigma-70 factor, ECF subfamily
MVMVYSMSATAYSLFPLYTMPILAGQNELDGLSRLDPQAIGAVYDRYYPDVYRFVRYRLNDETTAEDIASEVFVRLLEALKSGHAPQTSLKAWLLGTASHIVTDHFRQSYRRPIDELPETLSDGLPDPLQDVEQRERTLHLKTALSKLTEEQQNVLTLRFGQGYSLEETAALLKKNINAVKQLQFRALAALNRIAGEIL